MSADERAEISVLIFEDEADDSRIESMRREFSLSTDFRFRVEYAKNQDEYAEYLAGKESFHIYVVDLELERAPSRADASFRLGHTVVEILTCESPSSPIVVYSAYNSQEDIIRAIAQGAKDFVQKGENGPARLRHAVEQVLKNNQAHLEDARCARDVLKGATSGELAQTDDAEAWYAVIANGAIRAGGPSRYLALKAYHELRRNDPGLKLPPDPIVSYDLRSYEKSKPKKK